MPRAAWGDATAMSLGGAIMSSNRTAWSARRPRVACFLLGVLLLAPGCAPQAPPQRGAALAAQATAHCGALGEALRACAPASCSQPHPLVSSFTIEHRVVGRDGEACAYTQSVPGDMAMSCQLSEAGRSDLASQLDDLLSGSQSSFSFRFSTADPPQDNTMTRECVLRDRGGNVIPWGVSGDGA